MSAPASPLPESTQKLVLRLTGELLVRRCVFSETLDCTVQFRDRRRRSMGVHEQPPTTTLASYFVAFMLTVTRRTLANYFRSAAIDHE
jgi:hypothetical protein